VTSREVAYTSSCWYELLYAGITYGCLGEYAAVDCLTAEGVMVVLEAAATGTTQVNSLDLSAFCLFHHAADISPVVWRICCSKMRAVSRSQLT